MTRPDRRLGWATLGMLLALSLVAPVVSQAPADLSIVPRWLEIDWFFLFPYPLLYGWSAAGVWLLLGAFTLLLVALPWLWPAARAPAAVVDTRHCSGCGYCFVDCPYGAVVMVPQSAGRPGTRQARVLDDLCAGCGICVGACPSSSRFRSMETLRTGIERNMPQSPIDALRRRPAGSARRAVRAGADRRLRVRPRCARGGPPGTGHGGARPAVHRDAAPRYLDFALRSGADGVLLAACGDGDCEFRFGANWMDERIHGTREPHLRASVQRARVRMTRCPECHGIGRRARRVRRALASTAHSVAAGSTAREEARHG